MAIRFYCPQCQQLLSIASRKAGSEIECPRCGHAQSVPSEEAAAASLAMGDLGRQEPARDILDLVVYDDEPVPLAPLSKRPPPAAAPRPAESSSPDLPLHAHDRVVYRRQTLYAQAVLFLVIAGLAFAAGYLIGRGDASYELYVQKQAAAKEDVLVEGKVTYDPGTGQLTGDVGSVVILLPQNRAPDRKLSVFGIRPHEPLPPDSHATVRGIRELGGVYTRADASGDFSLVLPTGDYYVLLLSRHAERPPDSLVDELDQIQMAQYFNDPAMLLRDSKYRWMKKTVEAGKHSPIEHHFGRDKQEAGLGL